MLIKSRKLVNFSTIGEKKKSQAREPERVKTQKRPGSWKTSRLQQVNLKFNPPEIKKSLARAIIPRYSRKNADKIKQAG